MTATIDPLQVRLTRYVPHQPHMPQALFLALPHSEILYGGAAGGGKSDALLMAALQYVDVPGYAALILRKTYADLALPGAIMDRSKEWLKRTDARWNEVEKKWTFPSGATLSFGYLQTANDKYRYQGAEFQMIGFDELTQFDEPDYRYLLSRLRRPAEGPLSMVPLRMRAASNPGGRGHRWVKRRFLERRPDPDDPEDTWDKAQARLFVRAALDDNPSVDGAAYRDQLAGLDPQTRKQLLDGDWNAREPGDWVFPTGLDQVFKLGEAYDEELQRERLRPPVGDAVVLAADWGVHSHVLILWPLEQGGFFAAREIVNDVASIRKVAPKVAGTVKQLGYPVYSERFDASMPGLNDAFLTQLNPMLPWTIRYTAIPFGKYKALTIDYLRLLVANTVEHDADPHARPAGLLAISEHGCPVLADQIRQWRYADPDVNRTEKGDDHGPDALIAGAAPEAAKRRTPKR